MKVLKHGVSDFGVLEAKKSRRYFYYTQKDDAINFYLLISRHQYIDLESQQKCMENYPKIDVKFFPTPSENKGNDYVPVSLENHFKTVHGFLYKLFKLDGVYQIDLTNAIQANSNGTVHCALNYTIQINTKEINLLMQGSSQFLVLEPGKNVKFEIFSGEPSLLFLEIYECIGKVEVGLTNKYDNLLKENYDKIEFKPQDSKMFIKQSLPIGSYYIALDALKSHNIGKGTTTVTSDLALFLMKVHFLPRNVEIPNKYFYPGDDGIINYSLDFEKINLKFSSLQYLFEKEIKKEIFSFEYKIIVSDQELATRAYSNCDLEDSQALSSVLRLEEFKFTEKKYSLFYPADKHPSNTIEFQIKISDFPLKEHMILYINVRVDVNLKIKSDAHEYTGSLGYVYNTEEINFRGKKRFGFINFVNTIYFLLFVAITIFTSVGCYYYFRKSKKLTKKLQYEMSDVRNVGRSEIFDEVPEKERETQYLGIINNDSSKVDKL